MSNKDADSVLQQDETPATNEFMLRRFVSENSVNLDQLDPLPVSLFEFPAGWSSAWELTLLYNFAKYGSGSMLEIGPWIGRSTMALAFGLRDSQSLDFFDVVDFGITSGAEWEELLHAPFKNSCDVDQIARAIHAQGGSLALLIDNLRKHDLLRHTTTIMRGNALNVPLREKYDLVFCDTLHDEREVHSYGPLLNEKLSAGGVLVCDDIFDSRLGDLLLRYVPLERLVYLHPQDPQSKFALGFKAI